MSFDQGIHSVSLVVYRNLVDQLIDYVSGISLLLRLNNAFDQSYQWASNYYTAGRNVFVGVQWQPQ